MARNFTPRDYQLKIIDYIVRKKRCAVWAGMGLGKTVATLTAIDILNISGYLEGPALVLAPLRVAQSTWPEEAAKWEHTKHLKVSVITGTPKQRVEALLTKADIYTINYENIPWLIEKLEELGMEWPFAMVVADESTKLKSLRVGVRTSSTGKKYLQGQGGKRTKLLAKIAFKHDIRFVQLTGTPSPNGLKDLWGQIWFLDKGIRLGRTYTAFSQRWFTKAYNGFGLDPLPHAQNEIEEKLEDICMSLNAADYFDLDEPIENLIEVDLPAKARKIYKDMEQKMFAEIGEHEVEAFGAAARTMKCLQITNGAAYVGEDATTWEEIHNVKIQALENIIEEAAGMPVLVAYHFTSDLKRLRKAFPKGRVLDKNPKTLKDWNKGKIPILFAHPASAGHGLNLQDGGNILAFFSLNWNLEEHQQIIERIGPTRQKQAGHDRPVFIHYITAKNTVDQLIKTRLESKRDVQAILMEAMKARK